MTATIESGQLFLQAIAGPKLAMSRQPDGWFATKGLPARYGFAHMEDEQAAALYIAIDGRHTKLARIDAAAADKAKAANALATKENARPRHRIEIPAEGLSRYCGSYLSPLGRGVTVTSEAEKLFVQMSGAPRLEIYPESENDFFLQIAPAQISFCLENGLPFALAVHQNGLITHFHISSEDAVAQATAATAERLAEQRRPRTLVSIDAKLLANYTGLYRLDQHRVMTVTADEGRLFAQLTGQDRFELYPESPQDFFFTVVAAQVSFIADEKKRVGLAVLHQSGRDIPLVRMDAAEVLPGGSGHG